MFGHAGVDARQSGQLTTIVQTAMDRWEFDHPSMDVNSCTLLSVGFKFHALDGYLFGDPSSAFAPRNASTVRKEREVLKRSLKLFKVLFKMFF